MGARTITDEEAYLMYYFHNISSVNYSISELTTLFRVSKRTVCNYLNEVKRKIEKDNTLKESITNKFKGFEALSEYKKDLQEEIQEINYTATVRSINLKLIELEKKMEYLKQPSFANVDVVLQSVVSKIEKIEKIPQGFVILNDVLKQIYQAINEVKQTQDEVDAKIEQLFSYLDDYEEDSGSYSQSISETEAVKFG